MDNSHTLTKSESKLYTAVRIYVVQWEKCYVNYGRLGLYLFDYWLSSDECTELKSLADKLDDSVTSVLPRRGFYNYECQRISLHTGIPEKLLLLMFARVIGDLYNEQLKRNQ